MRRGRKQDLDPAVAAQQLSEFVLKKSYAEAEELLSRGIKIDVLQKIEEKNEEETITKHRSVLHMVVEAGDAEGLEWLAQKGANPNTVLDKENTSIIHFCVEHDLIQMLTKLVELSEGKDFRPLDLNKINDDNLTPTQLSIIYNKVDMGKLLLKAGASHNFFDQSFLYASNTHNPGLPATQLQLACASGLIELLETLCELGAPIYDCDRNGDSLLHISVKNRKWAVFDSLLEKGLQLNTLSATGESLLSVLLSCTNITERSEDVATLLSKGFEISTLPRNKIPPLHQAVILGDEVLVGIMLDAGSSLFQKDSFGNTAIHHAARLSSCDVLQKLTSADEKKNGEYSINETNRRGQSALHIACKNSMHCNVKFLMSLSGIDQNIRCSHNSTPLHEACRHGAHSCVEELLARCKTTEKAPEEQQLTKKPAPKGKKEAPKDEEGRKTELELEDANGDTALQVTLLHIFPL